MITKDVPYKYRSKKVIYLGILFR